MHGMDTWRKCMALTHGMYTTWTHGGVDTWCGHMVWMHCMNIWHGLMVVLTHGVDAWCGNMA